MRNHPPTKRLPQPEIEHLLTYRDAGELLGVTERTVWNLVDQGELTAVGIGRSVRIDPADLRAYIDRCKTPTKPPAAPSPSRAWRFPPGR